MHNRPFACLVLLLLLRAAPVHAQVWVPDLGNGGYRNPVLFADYSDPDVIRVGDDFYLVASSFTAMPGIPVLHSKDLVNWEIIGHVYDRLPLQKYDKPQHGDGSWAPTIRYHNGLFYVYFCTPYDGLWVATARNPAGPWELEHMVDVAAWEDPSPLWDDDGNAYLVHSKLHANVLYLHRMSPDGKHLLDDGRVIYEDTLHQPTIEGPKFLKKDGWYYILAPAGGVSGGWQAALRSKNVYGPYEARTVMHQGGTPINGPHQGGMVQLKSGEWWFMHFQDRGVYGRIVHLQPVTWKDGWPIIGHDVDGDGIGEPVPEWKKPDVGRTYPVRVPQTTDGFDSTRLGLQWQWEANPRQAWYSLTAKPGSMRLYAVRNPSQHGNLWWVPNLLLQKFPAPAFTATTRISFHPELEGERGGLVVMGKEWAYLAMTKTTDGVRLGMYVGTYDRARDGTRLVEQVPVPGDSCFLRVRVDEGGMSHFSYSLDGRDYRPIGEPFQAVEGTWIGAKVGIFDLSPSLAPSRGYADFDWFRVAR
ncbi:MAG TPA: glycoside hydrolase 43 family protein [Longimicrobiaceae bacterium]|nr:glycoside hydrolase 43 family protein [Longimicrobiaceae bacterium]